MITIGNKKYNTFKVDFLGETYELYFVAEKYADNKTLAVEAYDAEDGEPFTTLTVNLRDPQQVRENHAFFDVNNCTEDLLEQLIKLGLVEKDENGYKRQSGWVTYPLCKFNVNKFRAGRPKKKYWVDYEHHRPDGNCVGSMYWEFEEKPLSESESLKEAKEKARQAIKEMPYDKDDPEDGVTVLYVIDRNDKSYFRIANTDRETAERFGTQADEYADVRPGQDAGSENE